MSAVAASEVLMLAPHNKTLFSCTHCTVLHMPNALQPYKLLTSDSIKSYGLSAFLRMALIRREIRSCACVRAWAMTRELRLEILKARQDG